MSAVQSYGLSSTLVLPVVAIAFHFCYVSRCRTLRFFVFFFFNDTATPEIYPLPLHDPLPISKAFSARQLHAHVRQRSPRRHHRPSRRVRRRTNAARLNTLRTPCSQPHRDRSSAAIADRVSRLGSRSCLFVGRRTMRVNGTTAPRSTAAISTARSPPRAHAARPRAHPTSARDACITVPRR